MTIAELFVSIGVKGGDSAFKALGNVKKGLSSIIDSSIEAKAAVLGVMYAVERLTASAASHGASLVQFQNLTGLDNEQIQKWELAAKIAGGTAESIDSSVKAVQSSMKAMQMGLGAPAGFQVIASSVGMDMKRLDDTFYVMQKLTDFARLSKSRSAEGNYWLKSFGPDDATIAAMRSDKFNPASIANSMILSHGQTKQLDNLNSTWVRFKNHLQMFSEGKAAKYGFFAVDELDKAVTLLGKLDVIITKLISKFPKLGSAAKLAFAPILVALVTLGGPITALSAAVTGLIYLMAEWQKHTEGNKESLFGGKNFEGNAIEKTGVMQLPSEILDYITGAHSSPKPALVHSIVPNHTRIANTNTTHHHNNSATVHVSGAGNAHEVAEHVAKHVQKQFNKSYYQSPALKQGP